MAAEKENASRLRILPGFRLRSDDLVYNCQQESNARLYLLHWRTTYESGGLFFKNSGQARDFGLRTPLAIYGNNRWPKNDWYVVWRESWPKSNNQHIRAASAAVAKFLEEQARETTQGEKK